MLTCNAEWATGTTGVYTNYASGPYSMVVKSIAVTDYSTGSQYTYSGTDGTWQSITAVGGTVNSSGKGAAVQPAVDPSSTGTTNSPMPFQGTHSAKESTVVQPNAGGWTPTTLQTSATATVTTYPGLPAGWTVTSSGKVVPPSAAPVSEPPCFVRTLQHISKLTYVLSGHIPARFAYVIAGGLAAGLSWGWWI